MMMFDLPADLVEEILSKVPATALKRLRATCKGWNALYKDGRFKEKHFRKAPKQSRVLMWNADRLCSLSVDLDVVPPSIGFKDELRLKDSQSNSKQVDIAQVVFHCDGLLLCITREDYKPVVWNPCLGETRWIQRNNRYDRDCRFALGYANNESCRNYKILMFWDCYRRDQQVRGFEIYELSSNSWRVAPSCLGICETYSGVTLKGNTYWISFVKDASDLVGLREGDHYVLSFDFTRERFRRLRLPINQNNREYLTLSVVREELSLFITSIDVTLMEMWVTKKIDTEAEFSWCKSFAVDLQRICYSVSASLLIDEEKKMALCSGIYHGDGVGVYRYKVYVIGEDGKYYTQTPDLKFTNKPRYRCPFIFNYVPSLVQIQ